MIQQLIAKVSSMHDCEVLPPKGVPDISSAYRLPADIQAFYRLCGGMKLFQESEYAMTIVPPDEFVLSNPVIIGELCEYDISSNWYMIARGGTSEYITIDLAEERFGRCYDSFFETYGMPGDSPIIAASFTQLLERLLEHSGERFYWLQDDFVPIGDAYDAEE